MLSGHASVPTLLSVLILFLACILGCKATAPAPSWTKTKLLAQNEDHPSKIIADGAFVYFVTGAGTIAAKNEGTNNIKRISLKDGSVSVLVKGGEHFPSDALAVDDKFLYWSDGGTILRVRKDGGESEAVVSDAPGSPAEMVVDNYNLYWLIWSGGEKPHPVPVMFAPKKGGAAKQLAPPQTGANGICLDGDSVYWTTPAGIKKAPKTSGEAKFVYENPTQWPTIGLVCDEENFYYAQMNSKGYSALMKLAKKGGAPTQIAPAMNHTFDFVLDDANIYYFDNEPGGGMIGTVVLLKVSKNGGESSILDHGRAGWVRFIAVDKTHVYFTDIANVYALTK
jgi:sugar lactone lactonase YvrE